MKTPIKLLGAAATVLMLIGTASAAPVTYSFSTGPSTFGGGTTAGPFMPSLFAGSGASGTFTFDSESPFVGLNPAGAAVYGGSTPVIGIAPSFSALSGFVRSTAGNQNFFDTNGPTVVANDNFAGFGFSNADAFILQADSALFRNLVGFELDGFRLMNVFMLWIEGMGATTDPFFPGFTSANGGPQIPDFLTSQDLLGAPPSFAGRLWFDFVKADDPSLTTFAFFNQLQVSPMTSVPEPQTYSLLLTGLGLFGLAMLRKKHL